MPSDAPDPSARTGTRWGRVLGILALLLVLLLAGAHRLWGIGSARRLERLAGEYRAAGEPIEPADFVVTGVADADNAAFDLRAAAAMLDQPGDAAWAAFEKLIDPALPLRDDEVTAIRGVVAAHAPALALVTAARSKPAVDWKIRITTPVFAVLLPDLNGQRQLARFVAADALLAHHDGDHARAARRIDELLFIARATDRQPWIISHLVGVGITVLAADAASQAAPDLRVGNDSGAATRAHVDALIALLLDDAAQATARRWALMGERMGQLDTARAIASGTLSFTQVQGMATRGTAAPGAVAAVGNYLMRPVAGGDGVIMIRYTTDVIAAADAAPDWPAYRRAAPPVPAEIRQRPWRHLLASTMLPSLDRAIETDFRSATERRLLAVALAARLYAVDHDGRMPARLEDLVPTYLPRVPLDAMADASPLRYVADADDPLVYSVGTNGADDGGNDNPVRPNQVDAGRWQRIDAVLHLRRQPRPPPEDVSSDGVGDVSVDASADASTQPSVPGPTTATSSSPTP